MKVYISIIVCMAVILAGCTKTVNVKTPHMASRLVINSRTFTGDTITVKVSKSVDVKDYRVNADLSVTNATVKVYIDDVYAGDMEYDAANNLYVSSIVADKNKEYRVEVSAAGFETVTATTKVPEQVNIADIKRIKNVKTNADGVQLDEISIRFTDPATNGDHYVISILGAYMNVRNPGDTIYGSFTDCVYTNDPSIETIYNTSLEANACHSSERIFFNDILYNGKEKEIKLNMSGNFIRTYTDQATGETIYPTIALFHITDEYFRYLKSYQYAQDNEGNPFAEPTNAYSNVKNGYGMFSILSHDSREIK